jgi:hypothetical protein
VKVALKIAGKYVCAENGGDDEGIVHANRDAVRSWETWTLHRLDGGQVAFQSVNGRYLCAEDGGGGAVHANRLRWQTWETFIPVQVAGRTAYRTSDGRHYLSVDVDDPQRTVYARADIPISGFAMEALDGDAGGALRIDGTDFIDADGRRTVLLLADGFRFYERLLAGEDLAPLVRQWCDLGFAWIRVFFSYAADEQGRGIGRLVPREHADFYDRVPDCAHILNDAGLGLYATGLADAQRAFRSAVEQQRHVQDLGAALRGTRSLFSLGNEHGDWTRGDFSKNGFNPGDFDKIDGVLCSRSAGVADVTPYRPAWDFAEFRNRRDLPAMLFDTVASPWTIRERDGVRVPLVFDECAKFGSGFYDDAHLARSLASHYAVEAAGLCFHTPEGIDTRLLDDGTARLAEAWIDGARRQIERH